MEYLIQEGKKIYQEAVESKKAYGKKVTNQDLQ